MVRAVVHIELTPRQQRTVSVLKLLACFHAAEISGSGDYVLTLPRDYFETLAVPLRRMIERLMWGFNGRNHGPGLGNAEAEVLIVGDRPSGKRLPNWPFISLSNSGCSAWLAEELEGAGVPEAALYWTNAYTAWGEPVVADWIKTRGYRHIYALGKKAAQWCRHNGLHFTEVHHPMYWKRFRYGKPYRLTQLLRREVIRSESEAGEEGSSQAGQETGQEVSQPQTSGRYGGPSKE